MMRTQDERLLAFQTFKLAVSSLCLAISHAMGMFLKSSLYLAACHLTVDGSEVDRILFLKHI